MDADFDWLNGSADGTRGLMIPPGGAEDPAVLPVVRRISQRHFAAGYRGSWMMVAADEVVGLCNFIRAPAHGVVEIGYGVAKTRRGRGHATDAVAWMLAAARADGNVARVTADTAVDNPASARVLEKNGFVRTGERFDAEDGALVCWECVL